VLIGAKRGMNGFFDSQLFTIIVCAAMSGVVGMDGWMDGWVGKGSGIFSRVGLRYGWARWD
jgi:hypothetical protein